MALSSASVVLVSTFWTDKSKGASYTSKWLNAQLVVNWMKNSLNSHELLILVFCYSDNHNYWQTQSKV